MIPFRGSVVFSEAIEAIRDVEFLKKVSIGGWDYVWVWRYVVAHMFSAGLEIRRYGVDRSVLEYTLDLLTKDIKSELGKEDS